MLARGLASVMGFILIVPVASRMGDASGGYFYANVALAVGLLLPLIAAVRSVLGVKRVQGRTYLSPFDALRPIGTGQLVGLKVAITSVAVLLAWAAMGAAFWVLPTDFMGLGTKPDLDPQLLRAASMKLAIVMLVVPPFALTLIAFAAAVNALFLRNPRAVIIGGQIVAIYLVAMSYALATDRMTAPAILMQVSVLTFVAAVVTLDLYRRALGERIFGRRGVVAVLAVGLAAGAGALLDRSPTAEPGIALTPDALLPLVLSVLLPLLAMVLAPWSFARIRHR